MPGFIDWPMAHRTAEHQRYAAALQQIWPVPLGPLGARATTLFKRNSTSCLIGTHADVLSWLRLRTVFRHRAYRHAGEESLPRRVSDLHMYRAVH